MPSSFLSNKRRHHDITATGKGYLYVNNYLFYQTPYYSLRVFRLMCI